MWKRTAVVVAWLVLGCTVIGQASDRESNKAWIKYLKGEWTTEADDGTEVTKGTAMWRVAAKGNAAIGRFTRGDVTGVEVGGWQSDTKIAQINGFNSTGEYWQLEYKNISAKGGDGVIRGIFDGKTYSGKFVAKVIDENHWGWTIKGKDADGKEFSLSSKLTRKSD